MKFKSVSSNKVISTSNIQFRMECFLLTMLSIDWFLVASWTQIAETVYSKDKLI